MKAYVITEEYPDYEVEEPAVYLDRTQAYDEYVRRIRLAIDQPLDGENGVSSDEVVVEWYNDPMSDHEGGDIQWYEVEVRHE